MISILFGGSTFSKNIEKNSVLNPTHTEKRKINSTSEQINVIPIDSNYPTQGFGDGYAVKEQPKEPRFLSRREDIKKLILMSDLGTEVNGWGNYDIDQMLLRAFFLKEQDLLSLYPHISPEKLKQLKKNLVKYENR